MKVVVLVLLVYYILNLHLLFHIHINELKKVNYYLYANER